MEKVCFSCCKLTTCSYAINHKEKIMFTTCDAWFKREENNNSGTTEAAKHYQVSNKQPIEIMQSDMTPEQFIGFLRGNVIKYILRMGHKDDVLKEAEKAYQYSEWLVKALRGEKIVPGGK